jgi:predicted TIM-barrel fold metal-dependent hydrolase
MSVVARTHNETAVQVVDCDVHPYPSASNAHLLAEHTPEPFRSRWYTGAHAGTGSVIGAGVMYDPPEFGDARGMRADTRPPGGGFPCSDPDYATDQLLRDAHVDIAILEPQLRGEIVAEEELARCIATNGWMSDVWLHSNSNWHGRWRGSVCVTLNEPLGSARELERWAGDPMMVQALICPELGFGFGDPRCDPFYRTAARLGIPIAVHVARGPDNRLPISPVGCNSWYLDFFTPAVPLVYASHITSLIFDGALDRFPDLRFTFAEGAFTWVLPLMWRLDSIWEARRDYLPEVHRPPSEYIREHMRFATQPLEDPEDRSDLVRYLEAMHAEDLLVFSTDYPHWSYDDPGWAIQRIPKPARDRIMFQNAIDVLNLPSSVPALDPPDA